MLLESINALIKAGTDALQTTCGLSVTRPHLSLVRQGQLTFPSLGELHIRNGNLQKVHLGCDSLLVGQLAGLAGGGCDDSCLETLAQNVLNKLLEEMDVRNPRGRLDNLAVGPVNLQTRGVRTFGFRLETEAGQLFMLAEVPSKAELEVAKGSEFVNSMVATYLPKEWRQHPALRSRGAVDSFLVFLRKVEQDVYFEVPMANGEATLHTGFLVGNGTVDGRRALKFCIDLADADLAAPSRGDLVRAHAGIDDRSLDFALPYLGECTHTLEGGAELACAWFGAPEEVAVTQRRRAFRLPLPQAVRVELSCARGRHESSPWSDPGEAKAPARVGGWMRDLSFSGARIVLERDNPDESLGPDKRVRCVVSFPDRLEPLTLTAIIRRSTMSLADRNQWQEEVGVEFVVADDDDREALEFVRDYVLELQRVRLSQRIRVSGVATW